MQIHGVGSEHNHSMHQVTECMHTDAVAQKGSAAAPSMGKDSFETSLQQKQQEEGEFSLVSWLRNAMSSGRKLLGRIWGESTGVNALAGEQGETVAGTAEQVMAQMGDPAPGEAPLGQISALQQDAAAGTVVPHQTLERNPYFSAVEDTGRVRQNLWEKVKVRFQSVAGYLTGRFSGRNTFQTKQQRPKEDLRKHSRYRQDDLEIDCVLTDDSYLLDSYDSKGEYSKLSPRK